MNSRWFSFLNFRRPRLLYQNHHTDHPILVFENRRFRWLSFGNKCIQSAMRKDAPQKAVLPYMEIVLDGIAALKPNAQSLLMFGLGGGSFVRYFQATTPAMVIDVVEINSEVIEIAQRFFQLPNTSHHFRCHQQSAENFLQQDHSQHDIVFIDIFSDDTTPPAMLTAEFYRDCFAHLSENGLLIANLIARDFAHLSDMLQLIKDGCAQTTLSVSLRGFRNIVVFVCRQQNFMERLAQLATDKKVKGLHYDFELNFIADAFAKRSYVKCI